MRFALDFVVVAGETRLDDDGDDNNSNTVVAFCKTVAVVVGLDCWFLLFRCRRCRCLCCCIRGSVWRDSKLRLCNVDDDVDLVVVVANAFDEAKI